MAGEPTGRTDGVNLHGYGDIDMWTGPTRDVGYAVAGMGQRIGSTVPGLLEQIAQTHAEISANITELDETSKKYKEQANLGLPEFVEAVRGFPERLSGRADQCFGSVNFYVENDGEMARQINAVTGSSTGPESSRA